MSATVSYNVLPRDRARPCVAKREGWRIAVDAWYDSSYTSRVKTAVSIPDPVYERAEKVARRLGVTRSRLYSLAIADYLRRHSEEEILAALDAVYGGLSETLDPVLAEVQARSLAREEW